MSVNIHYNFFNSDEADEVVAYLRAQKELWNHYPELNMTNIGNSMTVIGNSYLRHLVKHKNRELAWADYRQIKFDLPVHQLLLTKMSMLFKTVKYMNTMSKPGFQIMDSNGPRIWHYDDEKDSYNYTEEFNDYTDLTYFDKLYSLTIMLTDGEFTYNYFPETISEYTPERHAHCKDHVWLIGDDCKNKDCNLKEYTTIKYGKGDLILTGDRFFHRIGPSVYTNSQERITLQGHGVLKDDVFYMYW